jgi:hypothetical protein
MHPWDPVCDLPVNPIERPSNWPECEGETPVCTDNYILNDLACKCFAINQCEIDCPKGSTISPVENCTCISETKVRALYPDWATSEDIEISTKRTQAAFDMLSIPPICYGRDGLPIGPVEPSIPEGPGNWPNCEKIPGCIENYYFN